MRTAQLRVREVAGMFRRRWRLVVYPTAIVTVICIIGAFVMPRRYESSTTILVRPDQSLKSLTGFEMMAAFEEELRNFSEIIVSRHFLEALVDTLGYSKPGQTEAQRDVLVAAVRSALSTSKLGSDSFTITYQSSDPFEAQKGASTVANLFITTKIDLENRQNQQTVEFLEGKVQEYRQLFEASTRSLVTTMKQDVDELPTETRTLYGQVSTIETDIGNNNQKLRTYQDALNVLSTLSDLLKNSPEVLRTESGKQPLLELQREDLPFVSELRTLLAKYDDETRRYTSKFPDVDKLEGQLIELLDRMHKGVENEIYKLQTQQNTLEKRRTQFVEELKKSSVASRTNQDKQTNYDINQKLYNEMKLKLEQARLALDIGSRGANQFIILDPAPLPTRATKPNRMMIMAGGFGFGLLLGIVLAVIIELFDTTLRTPKHLELYQKPVIALLPDARRRH
ncbi:MAG TPA: Wzz/FepE/Etk N-terminal domain-containing protein [Bacteroidota bacterium]|nr:Wzz/FepE/Etk N-terminal domain-containing protein [Bacteroidota bacterium]